ncbi:hypothetical protein JOB18_048767 [Solea senegalensis]|uniref:Uncharacterized protein n=1 Tax=Solea senegalensis TaxID=28829 RepID=A0AAV6RY67_SOLSE|nr:hypothetical protein JOB18_048767 [Solea senegalensis]
MPKLVELETFVLSTTRVEYKIEVTTGDMQHGMMHFTPYLEMKVRVIELTWTNLAGTLRLGVQGHTT